MTWRHREIDAIELPAAAEHLLRGIDVHDGQVAPERAGEARRLHHAANRELPIAVDRPQREPSAYGDAVLVCELLGQDDRIGLRQKYQRIVDDGLLSAFEVV